MASLIIGNSATVDYSAKDGTVWRFVLDDTVLFDTDNDIEAEGWEEKLRELITKYGLDVESEHGRHAFVTKTQ